MPCRSPEEASRPRSPSPSVENCPRASLDLLSHFSHTGFADEARCRSAGASGGGASSRCRCHLISCIRLCTGALHWPLQLGALLRRSQLANASRHETPSLKSSWWQGAIGLGPREWTRQLAVCFLLSDNCCAASPGTALASIGIRPERSNRKARSYISPRHTHPNGSWRTMLSPQVCVAAAGQQPAAGRTSVVHLRLALGVIRLPGGTQFGREGLL